MEIVENFRRIRRGNDAFFRRFATVEKEKPGEAQGPSRLFGF